MKIFEWNDILFFTHNRRLLFRNIEVGHLEGHEGTTQIHSGTAYVESPLQPTEGRFGHRRLQRDPAPGSGALNSFANQYPRIKMVVSRYGGGNEFQPHCCFSVDYFASQGALWKHQISIIFKKMRTLAWRNGNACAWLGLCVYELKLVNSNIEILDLSVLSVKMLEIFFIPIINWVVRIRLHFMEVVSFSYK